MSVQQQKKFIAPKQELTRENVDNFVLAFLSGALEGVPLR